MEELIGEHGQSIWSYSPRQLRGYLFLRDRRLKRQMARDLSVVANGSRGDNKTVKKLLRELTKP